jgi:predicted lipid-binding transport protein (Tim44 family)
MSVFRTMALPDDPAFMVAAAPDPETTRSGIIPRWQFYAASLALIAIGVLAGTYVYDHLSGGVAFSPPTGIGIFALFYVVAQVIERIQEPFAPLVQEDKKDEGQAKQARDEAVAAALSTPTTQNASAAANAQAVVEQRRANTRVLLFGTGALLGMVGCGYLHAFFLKTVGVSGIQPWVDLLITGLVVGGGTKLLHDLISNLQAAKDDKKDANAGGGGSG